MASLTITDLGDRYVATWQGDEVQRSGSTDFGPCAPPLVSDFTFGFDAVSNIDIPITGDLDDPALYTDPIYSVGLTVGIIGFTVPTWACGCEGGGCVLGENTYDLRLVPQIGDFQGNPVETEVAATGYDRFLGFKNPSTWPDLLWNVMTDGVHHWRFIPYATAVAYKVIPPSQPPPPPVDPPPMIFAPPPLVPPCSERTGPGTRGQASAAEGPAGRVRKCEDC